MKQISLSTFIITIFFLFNHCSLTANRYYSQWGQDQFIYNRFFKNKKNGTFIEIGAYDGITNSNTLFFEQLGWSGICIEPNPDVFEKLSASRTCLCVPGCIATHNGIADFVKVQGYCQQLSGLTATYDPRHMQRLNNELEEFGGKKEVIKITCFTFNDLCQQLNISHIDFLSIDTEGSELEILKSIDFNHVTISVITVENNFHDPAMRKFMATKGYRLIKTIACDEIYSLRLPLVAQGAERPQENNFSCGKE